MESPRTYRNCQSCGMPAKRDAAGGGTNADGSKSGMYCSHCYQGGRFTQPDMSAERMQELVAGKLKEFGFPGFVARLFTRRIPELARWKEAGPTTPQGSVSGGRG